jgi:phosphate starvation-inducible protein PhoH
MTEWAWWEPGREAVRVINRRDLWGTHVAEILSDATEHLRHVPAAELRPLGSRQWSASEIAWRASAARAVSLVAAGEPIATRSATVQLLPHQLSTLERAIGMQPVRLAICDEVGLGKTITAAAIFAEMKSRRQITRALVVAPKGVQLQWVVFDNPNGTHSDQRNGTHPA